MAKIQLNGPVLDAEPKAERPRSMVMTIDIGATATVPNTGEKIEIAQSVANPFVFILHGEKMEGTLDLRSVIQEALIHVTKENA